MYGNEPALCQGTMLHVHVLCLLYQKLHVVQKINQSEANKIVCVLYTGNTKYRFLTKNCNISLIQSELQLRMDVFKMSQF